MQTIPYPTPDGIIDLVRKTEYDALFQSLCEAEELIREIRDGEVNAQDEAAKFLRDHKPSELSKLRSELAASNASSENELLQMVQADNIQLLQQNERLIDARNKLREELKTTQKLLADANRGAERNAKANWELAGHVNEARSELAKWQALAGQLAEALENCQNFIEDAHIIEAQWSWEPVKDAKAALAAYESAAMDHAETPASTATGQ